MYETSPMVCVAAAALIDGESRILLQKRPPDRQHGGLWEFPGGKIEKGEGPIGAVIREIGEELGVLIKAEDLFPVSFCASEAGAHRQVLLLLYGCRTWHGDPRCEEGAELAWVATRDLASCAMPPLDVPLAKALHVMLEYA